MPPTAELRDVEFVRALRKELWLPALSLRLPEINVLHVPLIYASRSDHILRAYVLAVRSFLKQEWDQSDPTLVVDDLVLHFTHAALEIAITARRGKIYRNAALISKLLKAIADATPLPEHVLTFEAMLSEGKVISETDINQAIFVLSRAIEVNLANPFIAEDAADAADQGCPLNLPKFNHLSLYLKARGLLLDSPDSSRETRDLFTEHFGFLDRETRHRTSLAEVATYRGIPSIDTSSTRHGVLDDVLMLMQPVISELDPLVWIDKPGALLELLQYQEEWRHYWQTRLERVLLITFRQHDERVS
ncbi:hypothetical protein PVT71_13520 [Salipiger sp. H15]|uniref:Uncharacterized protein n=1 Tax=Alloyangia sp. H15 TaxID=3029062 RepID=A0AAU8AGC9_9RHOB